MTVRAVEGKQPYTGGTAIEIDENKVISLRLRDENNLIIYDAGDNEIYVDLQLPDELTPTDAFPVGITTGRVIVDNGWDLQGTLICAKTTSGDNIKVLYADEGTLWIDNGTGTFKQIYFKSDVDGIITTLTTYINGELAKKQNGVTSATAPTDPAEGDLWYDTTSNTLKVYNGSSWVSTGGGGGGGSDIEYVTQAEYNALLPGALTDNKHYFIYSTSGGGEGWQPGINTVAYFPFDADFKDYSGNGFDLTSNGGVAIENINGVTCANFKDQSPYGLSRIDGSIITSGPYTYLAWLNIDSSSGTENPRMFAGKDNWFIIWNRERGGGIYPGYGSNTGVPYSAGWHLVCIVGDSSNGSYESYKDGVYLNSGTGTTGSRTGLVLGTNEGNFSSALDKFIGQMSKVIFENRQRTAQEIEDYFNLTKGDYGIS